MGSTPLLPQSQSLADYRKSAIPSADDDAIRSYVNTLRDTLPRSGPPQFTEMEGWSLIVFAERMAGLAVRQNSPEPIRDGLFALIAEAGVTDVRESLGSVGVLWDAATRVITNPSQLFKECSLGGFESEFSGYLRQFPERPSSERTLEAWGYKIVPDADGFRYKRWGTFY